MKIKILGLLLAIMVVAICFTENKISADQSQRMAVHQNGFNAVIASEPEIMPLAPVTVSNTNDTGAGSLRDAITMANQTAGTTIIFNIPNTDPGFDGKVYLIRPATQLPTITQNTTVIDGTTQTTATSDTNPNGPEIVIDGSSAPSGADGLRFTSNNNIVRAVNVRNFFAGNGIVFTDTSNNNTVTNCYIGTDETGTQAAGNQVGIRIQQGSNTNTVGGATAMGNLISGNSTDAIVITGAGSDSNVVAGNIIGVDITNSRNQLPNLSDGVVISGGAKNNTVGGATADTANIISGNLGNGVLLMGSGTTNNRVQGNFIGTLMNNSARGNGQSGVMLMDGTDTNMIGGGNVIAFNARNGVTVGTASNSNAVIKNRITRNSIFSNGGLGIDLGNDGVTDNDAGDVDNGPNLLMNYPTITSVTTNLGVITVMGTIDTPTPNTAVVEVFTNTLPVPGGDASGFGEGQTFAIQATPNTSGMFSVTFNSPPNVIVTATATDNMGNTSEFSSAFQLGGGQPDLTVSALTLMPTTVNAGDTVRVTFTLRNQGTSSAGAARQDIVLSPDNNITAQDSLLMSVTSTALAPQGTQNFQQDITIPNNLMTGRVFIGVIADAANVVTESNENNNTANAPLMVNSMANLAVNNFRINPATGNPGDTIRVMFTVVNNGSANAGSHTEDILLSTDNQVSPDDVVLRSEQNTGLTVGSSAQFVVDVRIPATTTPGTYNVIVVADARNTIMESSETDNVAATPLTLSGSIDFDLTNLSLTPNTGAGNTQVVVSFQLTNRGSLTAPVTSVDVRFSNDNNITNSDTLLGTVTSTALTAGQSTTLTFTATIPMGIPSGRAFIGLIVDPQNSVNESNENNNSIASAFTIQDQAAPVVIVTSPNGGETVTAGGQFTINWTAADDVAVTSQDIFLSTDGGTSFSQVIITGLAGTTNSFVWNVPSNINTDMARVQVVARDAAGNLGMDSSNANFLIGVRPVILNPVYKDGKLTFLNSGSNIVPGAVLVVISSTTRETFVTTLNANGTKYTVKKSFTSSPSGLTLRQAIPPGVTVQLVVRNPNGIESTPIDFQRQ